MDIDKVLPFVPDFQRQISARKKLRKNYKENQASLVIGEHLQLADTDVLFNDTMSRHVETKALVKQRGRRVAGGANRYEEAYTELGEKYKIEERHKEPIAEQLEKTENELTKEIWTLRVLRLLFYIGVFLVLFVLAYVLSLASSLSIFELG